MKDKRFGFSIRTKLLLASLSLLVVPWLGYHYIQDLEDYLRTEQEQRLLNRAAVLAAVMGEQPDQFTSHVDTTGSNSSLKNHLYVRPLSYPIQLDGYLDDWQYYPDRIKSFTHKQNPKDLKIDYRIGTFGKYLYLLLEVEDDQLIYRQPNILRLDKSDHLRIGLTDRAGKFSHYWISTISPGWVNAYHMPKNSKRAIPVASEFSIKGEWQQTEKGHTIEIRLPINMIGSKFSFAFADVDDPQAQTIETLAGIGNTSDATELSTIVIPSPEMETLLSRLRNTGERIWVVDKNSRVMALSGDIKGEIPSAYNIQERTEPPPLASQVIRVFFRLILQQSLNEFDDDLSSASRLEDPTISSALRGEGATRWRPTENEQVSILTVAQPVYSEETVIGAVSIEETSNSILILQNRALEILISLSAVAFLLTIFVLLTFSTRLSMRIRKLRNEADNAITADGRINGQISASRSGDEIGDLNRSFYSMVERLSHYNRYLETMAGKLAHELRTPISVVRSSLDNLDVAQSQDETKIYKERALEGVDRLSGILARMSEATRLEQTLQHEETETFDLANITKGCIEGYRLAHPQQVFHLNISQDLKFNINGSPELVAQMLDKLISNARDFSPPDKPIIINMEKEQNQILLKIVNEGPPLPEEMQGNLFDSMVSVRKEKSETPHLGLGLYIARLIVDFHGGEVSAHNRTDLSGAEIHVSLPVTKS